MKTPAQAHEHHRNLQIEGAVQQIMNAVERAIDDPQKFRYGEIPIPGTDGQAKAIDSVEIIVGGPHDNDVMQEVYKRIEAIGWEVRMSSNSTLLVAKRILW